MQQDAWKIELREGYRTAEALFKGGFITQEEQTSLEPVLKKYRFFLPRYYAGLIDKNDLNCPIRRQAIPSAQELASYPDWGSDPLGDLKHQPAPYLTHRYKNRALLHLTPNCSMYCRFCFRKTLLNEDRLAMFSGDWEKTLTYLENHPEIEEIIFSGGDPFLANTEDLAEWIERINAWPWIERIRFHTRVPVTLPSRITQDFVKLLSASKKSVVIVGHFNHPKEITDEVKAALKLLPFKIFNQTVLLKGVNDDAGVLKNLMVGLFEMDVLPYYLHLPDRAEGTRHFDVSLERAQAIYHELRLALPGYLVPKLVRDDGSSFYKELLT